MSTQGFKKQVKLNNKNTININRPINLIFYLKLVDHENDSVWLHNDIKMVTPCMLKIVEYALDMVTNPKFYDSENHKSAYKLLFLVPLTRGRVYIKLLPPANSNFKSKQDIVDDLNEQIIKLGADTWQGGDIDDEYNREVFIDEIIAL